MPGSASMPAHNARSERLNIRVSKRDKQLIEAAAGISRVSASHFVVAAAVRTAEETVADQSRFVLSQEEWTRFVEMLDRPAHVIPALEEAARKPSVFAAE